MEGRHGWGAETGCAVKGLWRQGGHGPNDSVLLRCTVGSWITELRVQGSCGLRDASSGCG